MPSRTITILRIATAVVWLVFGVAYKILGLVPRHRMIVAAVIGDELAGPVTILIGVGEVAIAVWILSGKSPRQCMLVQTVLILVMNTLEITMARHLLLAPIPMVLANTVLLAVGWYCALKSTANHPNTV